MMLLSAVAILPVLALATVPYSECILTPRSRIVVPKLVYHVNGTVENAEALLRTGQSAAFMGLSAATYDFGQNVAGIVSFKTSRVVGDAEFIGISFTESSLWINAEGCDAMADAGIDAALWFATASSGSYKASNEHQRGGFRYLNVYHNTSGSVEVSDLTVYFTAIPQVPEEDLGAYTGHFHCEDDQLNRIWYAGAYTNELCTIDPTTGNSLIYLGDISSNSTVTEPLDWWLNYTISDGSSVLVDGAKRDRLVWPGDMAIAAASVFVSTNGLAAIRNSLDSLLSRQNQTTGALPWAGVPFPMIFSFTYHLYTLIGIHDYYMYSGDIQYICTNWDLFKLALNYSLSFVDDSGLANVTSSADWLRSGMGGYNIEANAILFHVLNLGLSLAKVVDDSTVSSWRTYAANIKSASYERLWDSTANLYRDNDTLPPTSLHPQDGNAWAVVSNLTHSAAQGANISAALAARWGPYGAPAPEAGATISPFISSFELQAHYLAGHPERAVKLMKLMWGDFMLDDPRMTNSTFIEGYSTDGTLHYAPYTNDARVSHAHGWATGPTSALTFFAAGLQITEGAGARWLVAPSLGGLRDVRAGYATSLGSFQVAVAQDESRLYVSFETPAGTEGGLSVEGGTNGGTLTLLSLDMVVEDKTIEFAPSSTGERIEVGGLRGGKYDVTVEYYV
ncbi:bacterial alpha-L-rhamnosidase domain-containing protein [Thozetella sp. PMI_491]|nr:bacterial alpha-L-rhamnosidase domain-containing protein [Thozetella sp. PMI_491]